MKILKYFLSLLVLLAFATSCTKEKFDDLSFIQSATTPSDLSVLYNITQDNSGLVTIVPIGAGSSFFEVYFGDGTTVPVEVSAGKSTQHTYAEGVYNVKIVAHSSAGKTAEKTIPLTVSFRIPENMTIVVENDLTVAKKVNISATANYAAAFDIYFGEATPDVAVSTLPGVAVSHVYANAGDYSIKVKAKSGGAASKDSVFTITVKGGPASAAPTPPSKRAADVIAIFSDAYTQVAGTDFNPNWGQSTVVTTAPIGGSSTLIYANLNYQGTSFASPINASAMDFLHVDVWTEDATTVNFYCISPGPAEKPYSFTIVAGAWKSYDIPLSHFSGTVNMSNLIQFKVDGTGGATVYFDNIYFYRNAPTSPTADAPTPPARDAAKVISVFSDAYTNVAGTNFNPNWGQSTAVATVVIGTGNTLKYSNFNYQGTAFATPIDASSMGYLHVDMWTYDATQVKIYPISTGHEKAFSLPITSGDWVSYDIPLTKFSDVVNLSDIIQFKFDGTAGSTIYLDNIYFY